MVVLAGVAVIAVGRGSGQAREKGRERREGSREERVCWQAVGRAGGQIKWRCAIIFIYIDVFKEDCRSIRHHRILCADEGGREGREGRGRRKGEGSKSQRDGRQEDRDLGRDKKKS